MLSAAFIPCLVTLLYEKRLGKEVWNEGNTRCWAGNKSENMLGKSGDWSSSILTAGEIALACYGSDSLRELNF